MAAGGGGESTAGTFFASEFGVGQGKEFERSGAGGQCNGYARRLTAAGASFPKAQFQGQREVRAPRQGREQRLGDVTMRRKRNKNTRERGQAVIEVTLMMP